jgi:hypothetical protein
MHDIDTLLRHSDPVGAPPELKDGAARALAQATRDETGDVPAARPRRSRRLRLIGGAVGVALVVTPLAAAERVGGIHTGFFPTKKEAGTEDIQGVEFLNLSDPGILEVVRQETAKVPLPAGASWDGLYANWPLHGPDGRNVQGQKPGISQNVQAWAQCAWEKSWLTGDAATRARAASVLADLPNWDLYAKWDTGWAPHIRQMNDQIRTTGDSPILRQDVLANCQAT